MSKKSKVYAVARGAEGAKIYNTWEECELNVKGYKGARYKSFKTKEEASEWIQLILATEGA